MSFGPLWAGLGPPRVLFVPPHKVPEPIRLTSGPPASGTQLFRPAHALGPHSPLGWGFRAVMWLIGAWHKPLARSKLAARIQCESLRHALLRTGHGKAFVRPCR